MSRLFWVGVGVVAGVALTRKAKEAAHQVTPSGMAANLGDAVRELATAVGAFGAEVRAGMAEREKELYEVVDQRSGVWVGQGQRPMLEARPAHPAQPGARARRAGD
jgi:chromosome condensin MukBEF MukE localization factor